MSIHYLYVVHARTTLLLTVSLIKMNENVLLTPRTFPYFPYCAYVCCTYYLDELTFHGNNVTGSISQALCDRKGENFFDLNFLTADCAGDPPAVSCDCCDECH